LKHHDSARVLMGADSANVIESESGPANSAVAVPEISLQVLSERVLLSALREQDAADAALLSAERSQFLADTSNRLCGLHDEESLYAALADLALPRLQAWCIVDVIAAERNLLRRVAVIHPEEKLHADARTLAKHWQPRASDQLGVPAVLVARESIVTTDGAHDVLADAARDAETLRIIESFGLGPFLVVPMLASGTLVGALTFVGNKNRPVFLHADILLAEAFAARCAQAIEGARALGVALTASATAEAARAEAVLARVEADADNVAKDGVLATVSHELRSPLGAIANNVQLLSLEFGGPLTDLQRTLLTRITSSYQHVMLLVNQLLDLQQIAAGQMRYDTQSTDVGQVISAAADMVGWRFEKANLQFEMHLPAAPFVALTDGVKLKQIIINLLSNAAKFTPAGGHVSVSTMCAERVLYVTVADTGIGIALAYLDAVFEPFVQVVDGRRLHVGGTGLGLSISREYARGLGGDLKVQSTVGEGSTFTLSLPLDIHSA
ncbi:MAG: GAF domain-containing sensor histidine kinase, partial [Gemmatimonadaceae bacterium]